MVESIEVSKNGQAGMT